MRRTIPRAAGRWTLMLLVMGSALLSAAVLSGMYAELNPSEQTDSVDALMTIYLPLVGVMGGFYLAEVHVDLRQGGTSIETFAFAFLVVSVWVLAPPILLMRNFYIEDTLKLLKALRPWGDTIAALAVAYYFSKGSQAREAPEVKVHAA